MRWPSPRAMIDVEGGDLGETIYDLDDFSEGLGHHEIQAQSLDRPETGNETDEGGM